MRTVAGLIAILACAAALAATRTMDAPPATPRGSFEGTWYRTEPGQKQVVQFRRAGHGWEVRFRWETRDGFLLDTGWQAHTTFAYKGHPGSLDLPIDPRSDDAHLVLRYDRQQEGDQSSHLSETGEVQLYRTGDGRSVAWVQPVHRVVKVGDPIAPYQEDGAVTDETRVWIFQKASRRQLEWDEVPW